MSNVRRLMSNTGISHPDVLDLVTHDDAAVRLILIEDRALSDEDAPDLQEKLNSYLGYALDGELLREYPDSKGKLVLLRIEFSKRPAEFITEFVHRYQEAIAQYAVQVELVVQGKMAR